MSMMNKRISALITDVRDTPKGKVNMVIAVALQDMSSPNKMEGATVIPALVLLTTAKETFYDLVASGYQLKVAWPDGMWPCIVYDGNDGIPCYDIASVTTELFNNEEYFNDEGNKYHEGIDEYFQKTFSPEDTSDISLSIAIFADVAWRKQEDYTDIIKEPQYVDPRFPETFEKVKILRSALSNASHLPKNNITVQQNSNEDEFYYRIPEHFEILNANGNFTGLVPSLEEIDIEYEAEDMKSPGYLTLYRDKPNIRKCIEGSPDNFYFHNYPNEERYCTALKNWAKFNAFNLDPNSVWTDESGEEKVIYDAATQAYLLDLIAMYYIRGHRHVATCPRDIDYGVGEISYDSETETEQEVMSKFKWFQGTPLNIVGANAVLRLQNFLKQACMDHDSTILVDALIQIARWGDRKVPYLYITQNPDYRAFDLNDGCEAFLEGSYSENEEAAPSILLTDRQTEAMKMFGLSKEEASQLTLNDALASGFINQLNESGAELEDMSADSPAELLQNAAQGYGSVLELLFVEICLENIKQNGAPLLSKFIKIDSSVQNSNVFDQASEPTPQPAPEPTPQPTPQPAPEPAPEPTSQSTPQPTPQPATKPVKTYIKQPTLATVCDVMSNGKKIAQVDFSTVTNEKSGKPFKQFIVLEKSDRQAATDISVNMLFALFVNGYEQMLNGHSDLVQIYFENDAAFLGFRSNVLNLE